MTEATDFIGTYNNLVTDQYCDDLIKLHEYMESNGLAFSRDEAGAIDKEDRSISTMHHCLIHSGDLFNHFSTAFWATAYKDYSKRFNVLSAISNHQIYCIKIQRTKVGEGYHVWHCENATRSQCGRIMNFILYLNDVDDGGETEFLYYHKRIKPKKGTLILFPAGYTHTHRGNPPLKGSKYILTGWVEL